MEEISFYEYVMSHESIWSTLYAEPCWNPMWEKSPFIEIKTNELSWSKDKTVFWYVWGWPGPDANRYIKEDYGRSWAFTKEELEEKRKKMKNER